MFQSLHLCTLLEEAMGPSVAFRAVSPDFNRREEVNSWLILYDNERLVNWSELLSEEKAKTGVDDKRQSFLLGCAKKEQNKEKDNNKETLTAYLVGLACGGHIKEVIEIVKKNDSCNNTPSYLMLALHHSVAHCNDELTDILCKTTGKGSISLPQLTQHGKHLYWNISKYNPRTYPQAYGIDKLLEICPKGSYLEYCAFCGLDRKICDVLDKKDKDTDIYSEKIRSAAMEVAVAQKWYSTSLLLITKTGGIEAADPDNKRPLMFAAKHCFLELTRWLIQQGANVNVTDNDGFTPLHMASQNVQN
eukprot:GHVR01141721.1.p1 GENE.GHVR01141721.1~~GHVR01141721.1.p1  ORF type:complete len:304 (-),score=60.44 GHVR01141721.1:67-978(-)